MIAPPVPEADLEMELVRVRLLWSRGQMDEAHRVLDRVATGRPGHPDVAAVRRELAERSSEIREAGLTRRDHRYTLGLDTTGRRIRWYAGCGALALWAVWITADVLPVLVREGLSAPMAHRSTHRGITVRWTSPAWADLALAGVLLTAACLGVVVAIRVSRGAADWEEIDAPPEDNGRYHSHWW